MYLFTYDVSCFLPTIPSCAVCLNAVSRNRKPFCAIGRTRNNHLYSSFEHGMPYAVLFLSNPSRMTVNVKQHVTVFEPRSGKHEGLGLESLGCSAGQEIRPCTNPSVHYRDLKSHPLYCSQPVESSPRSQNLSRLITLHDISHRLR